MRMLGIDYGTKKVGLALSDESGTMAFPHDVIKNDQGFLAALTSLIQERGVEQIVIGHSLNRDGGPNVVQEQIEALITDLTLETGLPIALEPEFYTTQQAARTTGKNAKTDAAAAALILESYLTKHSS